MLPNKSIMFWLVYTRPQNVIIRSFQLLLIVILDCEFFVLYFMIYCWLSFWIVRFVALYFMIYCWLSFWTVSFFYYMKLFTVDCLSGLWVFCTVFDDLLLTVFTGCEFLVLSLLFLFYHFISCPSVYKSDQQWTWQTVDICFISYFYWQKYKQNLVY